MNTGILLEAVVNIGDQVTVKVIKIDAMRGRVDLSMRPSDLSGKGEDAE